MFEFLGKNTGKKGRGASSGKSDQASLLDVVVPFPEQGPQASGNSTSTSAHTSLLSQFDKIALDKEQEAVEKRELERAERRAKKAMLEQAEFDARIEADRAASMQFEEKANRLAAEIERVRNEKANELNRSVFGEHAPQSPPAPQDYSTPHNADAVVAAPPGFDQQYPGGRPGHLRPEPYRNGQPADYASQQQFSQPGNSYPPHSPAYSPGTPPSPENYRTPITPQPLPTHSQSPAANVQPPADEMEDDLYGQQQPADQTGSAGLTFDLDKIFASIFRSWKLIGGMAVVGAVVAGIYAKSLPNTYLAWAELLIDPRDIKVLDNQLTSGGFGGETMIAYLESQLRIIESTSVLNVVIDKQNLLQDEEFTGKSKGGGLLSLLFPPSEARKNVNARQSVMDSLQDKLRIFRGSRTFIISIGMETENAEKSANIANEIATAYVNGETGARSKVAKNASEGLSEKLETLRERVRRSEQRVADYKAENGLISSEGKLIDEVQISRLNEQLASAKVELINAKSRMEQLREVDLSDVISGALPASLNTGTLSQLRVRYAALKSTADRLATKLGPKHPERIAATAELESAKIQMSREIRRSIAGSVKDYERANKRLQGLTQQFNTLKAAAAGTGSSLIALRELERELDANRRVYENYLLRSRETSEQEGLNTTNARVISVAMPPAKKTSPNRKVIAGIGLVAGAMLGLFIALAKGLLVGKGRIKEEEPQAGPPFDQAIPRQNIWQNTPPQVPPYTPSPVPYGRPGYSPHPGSPPYFRSY